ncbi:MAG: hypothetical protein DIZ80_08290 [endosymbiont of Galathealinum brachiosum]|uniref:Iron-binding zinc finger CDGSH type domain-containing protein n=1 Tax=endosymbiont of Galathealinum brachiosum TaxID=2200906 RepID=A0A370DBL0_9GAMM|nr:MAG: hypothetical protein DIZ80_08290 [endosymbiont of Galathealinum brachiosum]
MSTPECPQKSPYFVELEPGTSYWWCSCGKSKSQPFCDGSHKGSEFVPVEVTVTEKKTVSLCGCKQSKNTPICDGSHNKIS